MTLERMDQKFNDYVQKDLEWKKKFEQVVEPLVKRAADEQAVRRFLTDGAYMIVKWVAFIGSIGLAWHYAIAPLLHLPG